MQNQKLCSPFPLVERNFLCIFQERVAERFFIKKLQLISTEFFQYTISTFLTELTYYIRGVSTKNRDYI
jgi:hypothetical protein